MEIYNKERIKNLKLRYNNNEQSRIQKCRKAIGLSKKICEGLTCDICYEENKEKHADAIVKYGNFTCTADCRMTITAATGKIISEKVAEDYECVDCIKIIENHINVDFKGLFNDIATNKIERGDGNE